MSQKGSMTPTVNLHVHFVTKGYKNKYVDQKNKANSKTAKF